MKMRKGIVVMAMAMAACGYGQPGRQSASQTNDVDVIGKNAEERAERELAAMSRSIGDAVGGELLAAIASNDLARVNVYLNVGVDANYSDEYGTTPLGRAVSDVDNGPNPRIVEALLENGADPKALWGNCGTTPFFSLVQYSTSSSTGSAVLSNQVAAVRIMLKYGADPNRKQGLLQRSSLEYAAMRNGDIELIKALIDGGAVITDRAIEDAEMADVRQYLLKCKERQAEAESVIGAIAEWLEPYQAKYGVGVMREGNTTYLYCTFGTLPSFFNRFQIAIVVDSEQRQVVCYGFLPTCIPEERRRAMVEFIFRSEMKSGLSTASVVLDGDGEVRCQAWMPFESFALQPDEAKARLMGAVVDKLLSISKGVATVSLGGDPKEAADKTNGIVAFGNWDGAAALKKSADTDTKTVIERCFDKGAVVAVENAENTWLEKLSGRSGDVRVGIVNARFEEVVRDMGGIYDMLPYALVVREGMVWNICKIPEKIPDAAIGDVAEAVMRMNVDMRCALFGVDFDTGTIWNHYAVPVSIIPPRDKLPPPSPYGVYIKAMPVQCVASHSEAIHSAVEKVQRAQSKEPDVEDEVLEGRKTEEFLTTLLPSLGFDCGDGAKWGYTEQRYFSLKGYQSMLFVDVGNIRAACYGAYNILSDEKKLIARDLVEKLNKSSTDVLFHFDGTEIWCDRTITTDSLRRMTSPAERRKVLHHMLTSTEQNIDANKAAMSVLEDKE